MHFIVQVSIFFHFKQRFIAPHETGGKAINHLTFGEMVENLITWLKLAANFRGQSIVLFECPDAAADPSKSTKLKQLNAMLAQKPSMPMPPGFYVAKDKKLMRSYKVHNQTRLYLGEAKACSLEIIDSLLFETFGIHFLEPIDEV